MTSTPIPLYLALQAEAATPPEWVHLLPTSSGAIQTGDNRGPYHVADGAALCAASLAEGERLPIDENHATDLAAPKGLPAPARGWIVELQARADGIWGRVEWSAEGARLLADRAYRAISPVIAHDAGKQVLRLLRASLVNTPNLRGLAALNSEESMSLSQRLAQALGLSTDATEDQIVDAVTAAASANSTAMQSALTEIGTALGVSLQSETADFSALVAAARARTAAQPAEIVALQQELATVAAELATIRDAGARATAVAFVDGAIREGRVGVKPLRDRYVSMHMADPTGTEELIGAMPRIGTGGALVPADPPAADGQISLNSEQLQVATLLGLDPEAYKKSLEAERSREVRQ